MASVLAKSKLKVTIVEWDRSSKLPAVENKNNLSVFRMKLKAPHGPNLSFFFPVWWIYIFLHLLLNRYDFVQPQNLDNLLISCILLPIKRNRIVYDIADFYADSYVPSNIAILRRILAWLERTFTKIVDSVIIVDEARLKQMNLPSVKFNIIYNSPPDIYEELESRYNHQLHSNLPFTLFYAGILEKDRGLDTIFKAVWDMPDVKLIIAGFGHLEKEFSSLFRNIPNIDFVGRLPYDTILELTFSSDCIIALYDPTVPNNKFASPNKLFEAMMCAKPVIVSDGTAMANKVLKKNCGLVVNYGDVKELKKAIIGIKSDVTLAMSLGRNGREAYLKRYNWNIMKKRILKLYASAIQPIHAR